MGLFSGGRNRVLESGIEGTALIREAERVGSREGTGPDQGEPWPWELGLNVIGTRAYRFTLEVRIPDRDAYEVEGRFKVPRKAENTGFLSRGDPLKPGLELPVRVDPGDSASVEIDWDRFLALPGRKQAQGAATQSARNRALAAEMEKKPKLAAKVRAQNRGAVQGWAGAVRNGQMSREEFEETVTLEVETGRMDPADAEAARRTLD